MSLLLNEADLSKNVFLAPPLPAMTYTWEEIIRLRKGVIWMLLIASALPMSLLGVGSYIAFLVFIFDPQHHLRYGNYGLIPGIIFLVVAQKPSIKV
jgi:hypothetical protein